MTIESEKRLATTDGFGKEWLRSVLKQLSRVVSVELLGVKRLHKIEYVHEPQLLRNTVHRWSFCMLFAAKSWGIS